MEDGTTEGYEGAAGGGVLVRGGLWVRKGCECARVVGAGKKILYDYEGWCGALMVGRLRWHNTTALLVVLSSSGERHGMKARHCIISCWSLDGGSFGIHPQCAVIGVERRRRNLEAGSTIWHDHEH